MTVEIFFSNQFHIGLQTQLAAILLAVSCG